MKEWLLKEQKAKVGRPKLANETVLKKAKISIILSFLFCFIMCFCFFSILKGTTPLKLVHHLTFEKVFGAIENKDGFIVNYKYNHNYDYVMEFNVPDSVNNYSGSYKYYLYEMDKNEWREKKTGEFKKGTKNFKIVIKSEKNENKTWKIKLQITNASKIEKSYAPAGWSFTNASENGDMYAYKVFTVKGYYSPITSVEIKEANNYKNKITVITTKEEPREFILNLPNDNNYNVIVKYTDINAKNIILSDDKDVSGVKKYYIPNMVKSTKVTFLVYGNKVGKLKLSNWDEAKDKNGIYVTNYYILKPENTYKN